jgi:hypothetical protein
LIADLVTWLEEAPGLWVSEPTPVKIGGLDGVRVDLEIDPDWKKTCFFSEKLPVVSMLTNPAECGGYSTAVVPGQRTRWYILDSHDGVVLVSLEDGPAACLTTTSSAAAQRSCNPSDSLGRLDAMAHRRQHLVRSDMGGKR